MQNFLTALHTLIGTIDLGNPPLELSFTEEEYSRRLRRLNIRLQADVPAHLSRISPEAKQSKLLARGEI